MMRISLSRGPWRQLAPRAGLALLIIPTMLLAACSGLSGIGSTGPTGTSTACVGGQGGGQPAGSGDLGSPIAGATTTGALAADTPIHLDVSLNINRQALETCLQSIYDPSSPNYGKFLSPSDIATRFAPSTADIQKFVSFLTDNGLKVTNTFSTNAALTVDGTAAQMEKAFSIQLNQYKKNDQSYYTPDKAPTIPSDLQNVVSTIVGLRTEGSPKCNKTGGCSWVQHYSNFTMPQGQAPQKTAQQLVDGDCTLAATGTPIIGGTFGNLLTWTSLRSAYGIDKLGDFDNTDSAVGIISFDSYDRSDVVNYMLCAGSYAQDRIQTVDVVPGLAQGTGAGEATLDLEMMSAMTGPKTKIYNYQAPNDEQWQSSFVDMLNRVASDKKVDVLSISYGSGEDDLTRSYMSTVNDTLKVLAAEGISVFTASGDCAAYGAGQYGQKSVIFPASAPYATSVGGTDLTTDALGNPQSETAWVNTAPDTTACQNTWGTGGGLSTVPSFTRPSWQTGKGVDNQFSNGARQVPDVAAAAINISFYYSGFWLGVGGTSAASPIFAAGVHVANQALLGSGKATIGGVPTFYTLANKSGDNVFKDVTSGSNIFYQTTAGWDFATGWGSADFDSMATALGA